MPPDIVRIEVTMEPNNQCYVFAVQQTGGRQLVAAVVPVEDIAAVLCPAIGAYYRQYLEAVRV